MKSLKNAIHQYGTKYKIKNGFVLWATRVNSFIYTRLQYLVEDATSFKYQILRKIKDEHKTPPNVPN
jgi:hypothetical protein